MLRPRASEEGRVRGAHLQALVENGEAVGNEIEDRFAEREEIPDRLVHSRRVVRFGREIAREGARGIDHARTHSLHRGARGITADNRIQSWQIIGRDERTLDAPECAPAKYVGSTVKWGGATRRFDSIPGEEAAPPRGRRRLGRSRSGEGPRNRTLAALGNAANDPLLTARREAVFVAPRSRSARGGEALPARCHAFFDRGLPLGREGGFPRSFAGRQFLRRVQRSGLGTESDHSRRDHMGFPNGLSDSLVVSRLGTRVSFLGIEDRLRLCRVLLSHLGMGILPRRLGRDRPAIRRPGADRSQ
jgi:hypothetical protein